MFEHFTFGAVAQTLHYQDIDREISPSDCSFPSPITPAKLPFTNFGPLRDIVLAFAEQSLLPDIETESPSKSFCEMSSSDDGFSPEEMSFVSTTRGMKVVSANAPPLPTLSRNSGTCRRMKRQMDCQSLASEGYSRDIKELVQDMVASSSQCRLHQSTSRSQLNSPPPSRGRDEGAPEAERADEDRIIIDVDEDEGFAEMEDELWGIDEEMSLRRASAPSGIRKYGALRWRRSTEFGNGMDSSNGAPPRMKVRSVPRMRRRKPKSVPE